VKSFGLVKTEPGDWLHRFPPVPLSGLPFHDPRETRGCEGHHQRLRHDRPRPGTLQEQPRDGHGQHQRGHTPRSRGGEDEERGRTARRRPGSRGIPLTRRSRGQRERRFEVGSSAGGQEQAATRSSAAAIWSGIPAAPRPKKENGDWACDRHPCSSRDCQHGVVARGPTPARRRNESANKTTTPSASPPAMRQRRCTRITNGTSPTSGIWKRTTPGRAPRRRVYPRAGSRAASAIHNKSTTSSCELRD